MLKITTILLLPLATAMVACSPAAAPDDAVELPPPVIEGVWRTSEVRHEAGPFAGSHSLDVQPSVHIFANGYYGVAAVDGFAARTFIGATPTDAETGRAYAPFIGHGGTYTSEDERLSLSPLVAKDPALMDGLTTVDHDVSWVDGDAWLTATTPNAGRVMTRLTPVSYEGGQLSSGEQKLQGVWRRVEKVVDRGVEAGRHLETIQPGYYIFLDDKFVANFVSAFAPRTPAPLEATDEELGQVYGPYSSFGGRFDVEGNDLLTFWPAVTLNPNNMRGRPFQSINLEWQDDGDVWFVYTSTDGAQNRTRLTRVSD